MPVDRTIFFSLSGNFGILRATPVCPLQLHHQRIIIHIGLATLVVHVVDDDMEIHLIVGHSPFCIESGFLCGFGRNGCRCFHLIALRIFYIPTLKGITAANRHSLC